MTRRDDKRWILRYAAATRINHWAVAIAFVLSALSGLALFHPSLFWLTNLFGGGPWTRILHPFIALVMVCGFSLLGLKLWRDNILNARDWVWLRKMMDVVNNREDALPDAGRYNAGQKLLFWTIIVALTGLLASGIVIWRAYFSAYFPIDVLRLAALTHALFAFVLVCAIIVHIYAAIWVKGSIPAMTRGRVSFGWAWKHHRDWLRQMTKGVEPK